MSYDYTLFRTIGPVADANQLDADTVCPVGSAADVRRAIDRAIPQVDWQRLGGHWLGRWTRADGWYECTFSDADVVEQLGLATSHRATSRTDVGHLAAALGLVAVDMQTLELIAT